MEEAAVAMIAEGAAVRIGSVGELIFVEVEVRCE